MRKLETVIENAMFIDRLIALGDFEVLAEGCEWLAESDIDGAFDDIYWEFCDRFMTA